ncbi:dimethylamine monooxygenase subunit DmmA family protein [Gordonia jinhuaensis]
MSAAGGPPTSWMDAHADGVQWMCGEIGEVDRCGTSFLVVSVGSDPRVADVVGQWVRTAEAVAPVRLLVLDSLDSPGELAAFDAELGTSVVGVRIHIAGGQADVLAATAYAARRGVLPAEMSTFAVDSGDLRMYCAHCRQIFRVSARAGETTRCPGCARILEIHRHSSRMLGAFLASCVSVPRESVPAVSAEE